MRPTAVLAALLLTSVPARAQGGAVRDEAGLFSADARQKAEDEIKEIRAELHRGVVVETVQNPTRDTLDKMARAWPWNREKPFAEWAADYGKAAGVDGVYVLLYRDDKKRLWAYVGTYPEGDHADAFTHKNAKGVRKLIYAEAADHGIDAALAAALKRVHHDLQRNSPGGDPDAVGWPLISAALGVGVGAWFVLGVIQGRLARRQSAGDAARARERMTPALMGCLFGGLAGGWVYDQLLARERPPRPKSNPVVEIPPVEEPVTAEAGG